jgi:hypothetical protein
MRGRSTANPDTLTIIFKPFKASQHLHLTPKPQQNVNKMLTSHKPSASFPPITTNTKNSSSISLSRNSFRNFTCFFFQPLVTQTLITPINFLLVFSFPPTPQAFSHIGPAKIRRRGHKNDKHQHIACFFSRFAFNSLFYH